MLGFPKAPRSIGEPGCGQRMATAVFQWRSNWSLSNAAILLPKETTCHGFYDPVICVLGFHVASRVICVVLPLAKLWLQSVPR